MRPTAITQLGRSRKVNVTIQIMSVLDDYPEGDATTQLCGGIVAPLPFVIYGLMCIVNRAGAVPGRYHYTFEFFGWDAVILGIACLSFAAMLHFHYILGIER